MATDKQIAANRLNAQKSTGPRTLAGRQRSRRNAVRHGLTAETAVLAFESADEYAAFEQKIIADYEPRTTVEHQLIARLAALLWRLRRASTIESELFQSQIRTMRQRGVDDSSIDCQTTEQVEAFHSLKPPPIEQKTIEACNTRAHGTSNPALHEIPTGNAFAKTELAQSFLQLVNFDDSAFDRLGRYEMRLWRQAAQTIVLLNSLKWQPEDARRRPSFRFEAARQRRRRFFPAHYYQQR
jgi:hypothetical protein